LKKYLFPIALAIPLVLAACGNPNSQSETPSTTQQIPSETTTSSITTSSTVPTSTESTTAQHPIIEESTAQAEATEPYVVECLFGTPGPLLMSDGTTIHTDYCFYKNGGPEYLQQESWANSPDNPALAEKYAEEERLANIPYADGGTCPAYKCGYGTNSQGEPNPSSGELQAFHGCQAGYIDDPELCDAVAWVEHHEY